MQEKHRTTLPARFEVRDSLDELQFIRNFIGGGIAALFAVVAVFLAIILFY